MLSLNLILNSYKDLTPFKQKHILKFSRHKNFQKQNNEDPFIQLLNVWLHFTSNKFPPQPLEEIQYQTIY